MKVSSTVFTPLPAQLAHLHILSLTSLYFLLFRTLYPCRLWLRKIYEISRTQQRVCVNVRVSVCACLFVCVCVCKQCNFKTDRTGCGLLK